MIESLQFLHAYFVHLRDGSKRLPFGYHMAVACLRGLGRLRGDRRRGLADHHTRSNGGNLLLEFQNLLRESVDLRVLQVDFFRQSVEQRLRFFTRRRLSESGRANHRRKEERKGAKGEALHVEAILAEREDGGKSGRTGGLRFAVRRIRLCP